jgi:DNA-binding transcriptional ArsR family regulator
MPDRIDAVFSALADGRRRVVLEMLAECGSATATELAANLPVTRQAVAKHLGSLGDAGLVTVTRSGREARYLPVCGARQLNRTRTVIRLTASRSPRIE